MEKTVLNKTSWVSLYFKDSDLRVEFAVVIEKITKKFASSKNKLINYAGLENSEEYKNLRRFSHALTQFNLELLNSREQRLAFWLNLYNTLVINIIVSEGCATGPKDIKGFYQDFTYNINSKHFSLDDIEHGILRGNTKKFMGLSAIIPKGDARLDLVMLRTDPRIHFAFSSGTLSSPPLNSYHAGAIDIELDRQVEQVLSDELKIDRKNERVIAPKLFHWYKKDFGKEQDIIHFIAAHEEDPESKNYLQSAKDRLGIFYHDYDWRLNSL